MKDIFSGIYNKVVSFFSTQKEEDNSKEQACNRLKLVLMHDRAGLSENTLSLMRGELVEVISKYMEIDTEALDLKLESEGDSVALMLGIPILRARSEEEIQEILKKDEEPTQEPVEETAPQEESAEETTEEEQNEDAADEPQTEEISEDETIEEPKKKSKKHKEKK